MTNASDRGSAPESMPGLFAILPATALSSETPACVEAFLTGVSVASLLLPLRSETVEERLLEEICAMAQHLGTAVLTRSAADCRVLGADGVHLESGSARQVAQLRRLLGKEMIVGGCCPTRRHLAMEMGEAGADYLGIDQRIEAGGENLLAWWAEMFTLPVVAMHPVTPDEVVRLARLGADFVVPSPEIWSDVNKAGKLAAQWQEALRRS